MRSVNVSCVRGAPRRELTPPRVPRAAGASPTHACACCIQHGTAASWRVQQHFAIERSSMFEPSTTVRRSRSRASVVQPALPAANASRPLTSAPAARVTSRSASRRTCRLPPRGLKQRPQGCGIPGVVQHAPVAAGAAMRAAHAYIRLQANALSQHAAAAGGTLSGSGAYKSVDGRVGTVSTARARGGRATAHVLLRLGRERCTASTRTRRAPEALACSATQP